MAMTLCGIALLCARSVGAQQAVQDPEPARQAFEAGIEASERGEWSAACADFERSLALVERSSTLFNLALCRYREGRVVEALEYGERFLSRSARPEDERDRAELLPLIERARAEIALLSLELHPAHATVRLDGVLRAGQGSPREIRLDPGSHRLSATAEGQVAQQLVLSVRAGERVHRRISLRPTAVARLQPVAEARSTPVLDTPADRDTVPSDGDIPAWAWVGGGVFLASALVVTALVLGRDTRSDRSEAALTVVALGVGR